jgi:hypothetical protein
MVPLTGLAEGATPAGAARIERDPVSDMNLSDFRTHGFDRSGYLMAGNHRLLDSDRSKPAVEIVVEVGAANPSGTYPDQNLGFSRLPERHLLDSQIHLVVDHTGQILHDILQITMP